MANDYQNVNDFISPPRLGGTLETGKVIVANIAATPATAVDISAYGGRMLTVQAVGGECFIGFGTVAGDLAGFTTGAGLHLAAGESMPFLLQASVDKLFTWVGPAATGTIRYYLSSPLEVTA